jgi:hypothetical protein
MSVQITFFSGIVIRKAALEAHDLRQEDLFQIFEVEHPLGEDDDLISFGPSLGQETCDEFISRLQGLGLIYVDDFMDLTLDHPEWLGFSARLVRSEA